MGTLATAGLAGPAFGHGYIGGPGSELTARQVTPGNTNLGAIVYEPQSLEGAGNFPVEGPPDGHIASAGKSTFYNLDEQTATRWVKNVITPGPHKFGWVYTAPHNTDYWKYYITKKGWNPNAPLTRDEFEVLATFEYDGRAADTYPVHTITIPNDRTGYYVILAQWEINDTGAAFYNVVDVDIQPGGTTPTDTTAPSVPTGVSSAATTTSSVDLRWTASTDNTAVTGYRVERATGSGAFAQVGSPTGTSFLDSGLAASTTYRYRVSAVDAAGNVSAASAVFSVTTGSVTVPDTTAPSAPSGVHSMATTTSSVDLMWTASTDDRGVTGYRVERATGSGAFAQVGSPTGTSFVSTGLAAATTYRFRVSAVDAAGNVSAASAVLSVTTSSGTTNPGTYPTWNPRGAYTKGDRVTWNGKNYEAVQSYQGAGDSNWINAGSLWKVVS